MFIDASAFYEKGKNQNILHKSNIDDIIDAYKSWQNIDKYCHIASLSEIQENDYNLNISRYVDTFEEEEEVDLAELAQEIRNIDQQIKAVDQEILRFCEELQIEAPL